MLVSIVVPFYSVEPYFKRCLDSIVNQSYQNLEIILVNDCSPDNSIAIACEYAQKDNRIIIIEHEKNLRQGGARNSGMAVATGEYIWFIDSDDEISTPYAVEHLVAVARRDDAEVVLFNAVVIYSDRKTEELYNFYSYAIEQIFNDQRPFYPVFCDVIIQGIRNLASFGSEVCFKFFKVSFLRRYQFQFLEHTIHEDIPHLAILALAKNVTQLPYSFYYYYQRPDSTMNAGVPIVYLEHLERLWHQVSSIYDRFWIERGFKRIPSTVLMLFHGTMHAGQLISILKMEGNTDMIKKVSVDYYNLLATYAGDFLDEVDGISWPNKLGYEKKYRMLFSSFERPVSERRKFVLVRRLFRKSINVKTIIKQLMPYGLSLWLLEKRGWNVAITRNRQDESIDDKK